MNNKLLLFILAIALITPSFSKAEFTDIDPLGDGGCVSVQNNLRYRSTDAGTGGEVTVLQDFLQAQGYLNSSPSGFFGLMTLESVRRFQSDHSISPTGYVGPLTRAEIKAVTCGRPTAGNIPPISQNQTGCFPGAVYSNTTGALCNMSSLQPSMTVISPSGGESYRVGDIMDVRWTSSGIPSDNIVNIRLKGYTDGKEYNFPPYPLQSYNDGSESVRVQSTIPIGSYILELKTPANGGGSYLASSNSYFKIVNDTPVYPVYVPSVKLSASPDYIYSEGKPGATTLSWSSANATVCGFEKMILPTSGSMDISISQTATFTLTCTGPGGTSSSDPVTVIYKLNNSW